MSDATGISCLIRSSLNQSSSFSSPHSQETMTVFTHAFTCKLTYKNSKGRSHRCSASPVAKIFTCYPCQPSQWVLSLTVGKHILPCHCQKHIYLFSNDLCWAMAMLWGKRVVISTICLHNCACYWTIVGSDANAFYLESSHIHPNFPVPFLITKIVMQFGFILQKVC